MPVSALPQETARRLTSSVALTDAVSMIKELVDNALDAHATAITIELSANTIDVVQVKDNGTGIGVDDRQLLCRRGCTSKIRTMDDLASLGGSSLGFRGEALFSACNVSGSVSITTRVEGEVVGASLQYGPNGKMLNSSSASHPVGSTVRVQDFLTNIPVRKQAALRAASKTLTNIRKLLSAYAFARPEVRLSFKVLKAKNDKANWNYAPSTSSSVLTEAASKIVGAEVASQLLTHRSDSNPQFTEEEMQGFKLEALLIDPKSEVQKACNSEQFMSVDNRPVSTDKDLMKDLSKIYKKFLRNAISPESTPTCSKPFLCLRILCPAQSYDINIEPAKDRVMFYKPFIVSEAFENMLGEIYGDLSDSTKPLPSFTGAPRSVQNKSFDLLLARKPETTSTSEPQLDVSKKHGDAIPANNIEEFVGDDDGTAEYHNPEGHSPEGVAEMSDNPWSKAKMNVRLYPRESTQDSAEQGVRPAGPTPITPHQTTLGLGGQLLTPRLSSGDRSASDTPASDVHSKRQPSKPNAQWTIVPPFKTPRLSQFSSSPEQHSLSHAHPGNPGHSYLAPSQVSPASRPRSAQELDDILDFERQKKALSQQRKNAMRAIRKHQVDADLEPLSDAPNYAESPRSEDYDMRFGEGPGGGEDRVEELRTSTVDNPTDPHRIWTASARSLLTVPCPSVATDGRIQEQHVTHGPDYKRPSIPDADPRAYLLRQRKLDEDELRSNAAGLTRTGLKIRRVKSTKLPLEAIPSGEALYTLAVVLEYGIGQDEKAETTVRLDPDHTKRLASLDEYVKHGDVDKLRWASIGQSVSLWDKELLAMIQNKYGPVPQAEERPGVVGFDLAIAKAIKAHVDTYGD